MADLVPLLKAEHLTMRFGGVVANDDITFRLEEMELRCLIGPNGAGKSTFFKTLTGQLVPTSGAIAFRGHPIAGKLSHEIARMGIGIKTQVPNVFNGLSVRENIWLAVRRKATPRAQGPAVDTVLEMIRLTDHADRIVATLSHGQRQWVEIGMVLAAEPELILLDEPAAGMTDEETLHTAAIIREINKTRAIIVVEHDMEFIRQIAKKVTVFHQGRVLVEDSVEKVMADQRVRDVYLGKKVAA
ncbi:ATP-binding cassette domain-containing protein [Bradyrhizobium daqingense]|uniref:Branched-chain amino acid transport system ATP-binding protein/urea transport system ATP-binding protein n=1 Tax=Bradyrhizobium daqingense TaxID=993502 RepID=A0A562KU32_9BRAD|nr:ATP-binding cassette domain-containing protein [Bradyrhizobium daqingense]TWH98693.1 branched-chain amino acid transport system ATP-binding protein/urea transport system ATP-binding protein [Bradyrhizobium daqingense]UFS86110.1 ATP-binding cassette domain-containing protein [Bradyrhizobium daqingense]